MYVECKYYNEWVYVKDFYNSNASLKAIFPKRTCIDMDRPGDTWNKEQLSTDEILSFNEWCKKVNIPYPFDTYNKVKCIYSNTSRFNKDIIYDCKGNEDYFKYQGIQYSLIQKNYRFIPVVEIKSKKKLITDLDYPDVIHIKSESEYNKIKKYIKLTKYSSTYNWILIKNKKQHGQGMHKYTGQAFNGKNYINYEFEDLIFPEGDFILPERWAIKVTTENAKMLGKFYGKHAFEGYEKIIPEQEIGKYYTSHNVWSDNSIFSTNPGSNFDIETLTTKYKEYEEITTEQFKKYILDKMKPEKDIIKVFNKFNIGDIVVSLTTIPTKDREQGTLLKVLKCSDVDNLHYCSIKDKGKVYSTVYNDWRLATPEEIKFYNSGGKNINDMKNEFDKLLVTDLKKGQYYYIKTISTEWISIFEKIEDNIVYDTACIAISGSFYRQRFTANNGWGKIDNYTKNIRLATQEEKNWLNTCIMINKFVSKETALEMRKEKKEFKKNDYIVLISSEFSMSDFTIDYCYKVRDDGNYLMVYKDDRLIENGYYACQFDNTGKIKWRYAIEKEIIEYDRLDRPFNTIDPISRKIYRQKELLAKAIRDYPVGTFYIPAHLADNDNYYQEVYEDQTVIIEGNYIYLKNKHSGIYNHPGSNNGYNQVLYNINTNKWARIIPKPKNTILQANTGKFKKGDKVRVIRAAKSYEGDWKLCWISVMNDSVGTIVTIDDNREEDGYFIKETGCVYPEFVLELVSKVDENDSKENFKHFHSLETKKIIPIIVKINK